MTVIHIVWTLALLCLFVGIVVWAYSSKRRSRFEEAANLPFEEDVFIDRDLIKESPNQNREVSHDG